MTKHEAAEQLQKGKVIRHYSWDNGITVKISSPSQDIKILESFFILPYGWLIVNETHQEALERLQLKVGDKVKVLEKAEDEKGWMGIWEAPMNQTIGNVLTISYVNERGIGLKESGYHFPAYVLEKVQEVEYVQQEGMGHRVSLEPQPNKRRNPTIEELREGKVELICEDDTPIVEYYCQRTTDPKSIYVVSKEGVDVVMPIKLLFIRPKTITKWYNLYKEATGGYHISEEQAKEHIIKCSHRTYLETKSITFEI